MMLDLNDEDKTIISKHLLNDNATTGLAIDKTFMTKPDDDLQKKNWLSKRDGHQQF